MPPPTPAPIPSGLRALTEAEGKQYFRVRSLAAQLLDLAAKKAALEGLIEEVTILRDHYAQGAPAVEVVDGVPLVKV